MADKNVLMVSQWEGLTKDTRVLPNVERTLSFMEHITENRFSLVLYKR